MSFRQQVPNSRLAVLVSAAALFAVWLVFRLPSLAATQNGLIRWVLPMVFSLLILLRRKATAAGTPADEEGVRFMEHSGVAAWAGVAGTLLALAGLILPVHQLEWIGILLLLFACLWWALPRSFHRDIVFALVLLYWAHPIPSALFGSLQLAMQHMSVRGSEWLLHMLNIRVWADGLVLRTPFSTYEVPEWCSGMRTATTVFLLALGLGILRRHKWYSCLVLIVAALLQALALNVLRISALVALVPGGTADGPGAAFLHDTAGLIVLAAVILVYAEILLWERYHHRKKQDEGELNPHVMTILTKAPPSLARLYEYRRPLLTSLAIAILAAGLTYKSRPFHRAEMIKGVVTGLSDSGKLEEAQRAAQEVQRLQPGDEEWKLTLIRLQLLRGHYEAVLAELARLPDTDSRRITEKNVLKAYAYMGLNQMDRASALAKQMLQSVAAGNQDPRLAMVLAEIAFYANDVDAVVRNVTVASRWNPNARRIRALFPYLRLYGKWDAIASCDIRAPYTDAVQAFCAVEAFMNIGDMVKTADLTLQILQTWPNDPRTLEPLFFMTLRRADSEWEDRFATHLIRTLGGLQDPEALYRLTDKCFQLSRPDLAWLAVSRIATLDPTHPALFMSAVRYGDAWFSFRKRQLGIRSPSATDTTDLRSFYRLGRHLAPWRALCERVPFGAELSGEDTVTPRKALLDKALAEFRKRENSNQLSVAMEYEYVKALERASRVDEAKAQLAKIATHVSSATTMAPIILSEIYERRGDWQNVYETLRGYPEPFGGPGTKTTEPPQLPPLLRLGQAQLNLRMGLAAIRTAQEARRLFPHSPQAVSLLATALADSDTAEEALLVLGQFRESRQRDEDVLEATCLYETQRFAELRDFCRIMMLPPPLLPDDTVQSMVLLPAEMAVLWHRISIPSDRDFAATASGLRRNLEITTSPFFRRLIPLWLACYERRCGDGTAVPEKWTAVGRDRIEKVTALSQLTQLLCWQERFLEARNVAGAAVKLFPESPTLWRMLISLSGVDAEVIAAARKSCPADSEIWLAEVVSRGQASADQSFAEQIRQATEAGTFTPAAMTRAGDYLLRRGFKTAASLAARDATRRARGLVPAYVLGLQCALADRNKEWALECTKKAVAASLHPPPLLYRKLVELKTTDDNVDLDADMVQALKSLRLDDPGNATLAQMLGYIRFKRGGSEVMDAMFQMIAALEAGATNRTPYLIAAEASRLIGNSGQAAEFLRNGLKRHPNDLEMLNNLVFTLALTSNSVAEAMTLVPQLESRADNDPHLLDTLVVAYLHAGQLDKAEQEISVMLSTVEDYTPLWFRANLHRAEIAWQRGNVRETSKLLRGLLRYSRGIPDEDILAANKLLTAATVEEGPRGQ